MKKATISLHFATHPPTEDPLIEHVSVNGIELVDRSIRQGSGSLSNLVDVLLMAAIDISKHRIEKDTRISELWDAIKPRQTPRAKWVAKLKKDDLLGTVICRDRDGLLSVVVPKSCIQVYLNNEKVSDRLGVRDLLRRRQALADASNEAQCICDCADLLDRHGDTRSAVELLKSVRQWNSLCPKSRADVKGSLGKYLSHLGKHEEAIEVLQESVRESGIAEELETVPGVWRLHKGEVKDGPLSPLAASIVRCLLQLSIVYKRYDEFTPGELILAKRQLLQLREYDEEVKSHRLDLYLSIRHQEHRLYEAELLKREGAEIVIELALTGYRATDSDWEHLDVLKYLANSYEHRQPRDPQRIAFEYRGLGEWFFLLGKTDEALRSFNSALDLFDQAADKRNFESTGKLIATIRDSSRAVY